MTKICVYLDYHNEITKIKTETSRHSYPIIHKHRFTYTPLIDENGKKGKHDLKIVLKNSTN